MLALEQLPQQSQSHLPLVPGRLQRLAPVREPQRDLLLLGLALQRDRPQVPARELQRHQLVPAQGLRHQTSLHLLEQERVLRTTHPLRVRETARQTTHHLLVQAWRQTTLPKLPAWIRTNHLPQERVLGPLVQS